MTRVKVEELSLFKRGKFKLHSGGESWFLIDCEALTDEDIEFLAEYIVRELGIHDFEYAHGIPRGGSRLADMLNEKYGGKGSINHVLIVDDVCTSGNSLREHRKILEERGDVVIGGVVIFNRGKCPDWVTPIFTLTKGAGDKE